MKFIASKVGITLLILFSIISYGLYDFYITGVTGGRTGPSYARDDDLGYYLFMILYSIGALLCVALYLYLFFNPHVLEQKNHRNEDEPEK